MAIDQFRTADILIDKIGEDYIPHQYTVEGERSGRSLTIQITNGGVVESQSGLSLNLGWTHQTAKNIDGSKLTGLDSFSALDRSKGIFRIDYTSNMMVPGIVDATIQIVSGTSITLSKPFKIKVDKSPIDEDAAQNTNSFTALSAALVQAQDGGPFMSYDSLSELNTEFPNGRAGFAVISGYAYWWKNGAWIKKDVYQSQGIADESVTPEKLKFGINQPYISDAEMKIEFGQDFKIRLKPRAGKFVIYDATGTAYSIELTSDLFLDITPGEVSWLFFDKADSIYKCESRKIASAKSEKIVLLAEIWYTLNARLDVIEMCQHRGSFMYNNDLFKKTTAGRVEGEQVKDESLSIKKFDGQINRMQNYLSGKGKIIFNSDETVTISGAITGRDTFGNRLVPQTSVDLPYHFGNIYILGFDVNSLEWSFLRHDQLKDKAFFAVAECSFSASGSNANHVIETVNHDGQFVYNDPNLSNGSNPNLQGFNIEKASIPLDRLKELPAAQVRDKVTLASIFNDWESGIPTQIGIIGDSTTNGSRTTGYIPNTVAGEAGISPNAYPNLLNDFIKNKYGFSDDVILNGGYTGQQHQWLDTNKAAFLSGEFANCKLFILRMGLNDRNRYTSPEKMYEGVKASMTSIVEYFLSHDIQVVFATPQAIVCPATEEGTTVNYNSRSQISVIRGLMKEMCARYNLELVDLQKATESFLMQSKYARSTIIPDNLHFSDTGHAFTKNSLWGKINPLTIKASDHELIGYMNQGVDGGIVNRGMLTESLDDPFKMIANTEKDDTTDQQIFEITLNCEKKRSQIKLLKSRTESTSYAKINDQIVTMTNLETIVDLDIDTYVIEIHTGNSSLVDFRGIKLEF